MKIFYSTVILHKNVCDEMLSENMKNTTKTKYKYMCLNFVTEIVLMDIIERHNSP